MSSISRFDDIVDAARRLPLEQQTELVELLRRRLAEQGRDRIGQDIQEGRDAFSRGNAKVVTVDEFMREIDG